MLWCEVEENGEREDGARCNTGGADGVFEGANGDGSAGRPRLTYFSAFGLTIILRLSPALGDGVPNVPKLDILVRGVQNSSLSEEVFGLCEIDGLTEWTFPSPLRMSLSFISCEKYGPKEWLRLRTVGFFPPLLSLAIWSWC